MLEVAAMHKKINGLAVIAVAALCLALAAAFPAASRADHLGTALGADGQLYVVTAGLYGTLFPGSNAYDPSTPVLALDTTMPGAAPQRQLVQGTADGTIESSPALIYEDGSKTLYVVWVSNSHSVSSVIKLTSYSGSPGPGGPGGQWSPAITIISNPYASKTPPQLAVTRDTHQETDPVSGNPVTRRRTVLHVVWSEDSASGLYQAYYAPVIFEDGTWIGTVPTPTHLDTFDALDQSGQTAPGAGPGPFSSPLAATPTVQPGRDTSTVVTGFASNASGMVTAVEVDVLPEELRILADTCAGAVLGNGAQYFPGQPAALAAQVQTVILSNGGAFQAEALQAIANAAQGQIAAGATDLPSMANKIRATIVDTGAKFAMRGLRIVSSGLGIAPPQLVEVLVPNAASHFLQFRVTSTRPLPAVSASALQLFLSRTGLDALAAWTGPNGGNVLYTNTQPDGTWSSVKQLQVTSTLNLQQAYQVLEQRMQY
jgi:hypothetical protein